MSKTPAHAHSTTRDAATGRIRVEDGSTAQATGSEFTSAQVSTAALAPQVARITAPEPIDLTHIEMTVSLGGVTVQVFEASAGTQGGTFSAQTVQPTNLRNPRAPSFTVESGGTFTPTGPALQRMTVSTGASGANLLSNTRRLDQVLSLPAGTYFIVTGLLSGVTSFTGELLLTISEALD